MFTECETLKSLFTESSEVLKFPQIGKYAHNTNCVWKVSAPVASVSDYFICYSYGFPVLNGLSYKEPFIEGRRR